MRRLGFWLAMVVLSVSLAACGSCDDSPGSQTPNNRGADAGDAGLEDTGRQACTSDDDCASDQACAIVADSAGSALESVCVADDGRLDTGQACTIDEECASLVCLTGTCAAPCTGADHCASDQRCQPNTISKDQLSGEFDVCEVVPDERCDQTGTCSDGAQLCSEIRAGDEPDTRWAYCTSPDESAPSSLGEQCSSSSDCRSKLCLANQSDTCSVVCVADDQCNPDQICTTFSVGISQMGFCIQGCTDDASCSGLDFTDADGNLVEHVCTINENTRTDSVDQICVRKNIVDAADPAAGELGDSCSETSDCQSGLCLRDTTFSGRTCSSEADCDAGQVCEEVEGGATKQCADVARLCTRLCDDQTDCTGGVAGNDLTACDSDVDVSISGTTDTISACASPN